MARSPRLGAAVMFVSDLERSVRFYADVLGLPVVDRSPTAALLGDEAGTQLVIRAMGTGASHALGGVGVQYLIWIAEGPDQIDRCERVLRDRSAHRETRSSDGVTAVEGRDPDDIVVMILDPGPDRAPLHELPVRAYAW
jgi:catechol 2,3-dioxygenase-like lactoylglutathione lyase family enzyme